MRRTRLPIALLALALVGIALAGCGGGSEATKAGGSGAPVTLRLGTDDNPGRPAADQIEEFARRVDQLSGGKIRIEPVWNADGRGRDDWDQRVARMVASGELDMGLIPSRAWDTEGVTSLRVLNAPFLVTSEALLGKVVSGELADEMLSGLGEAGVVGLALVPEGLRHPFGFEEPLLAPDDYAGQTIRTPTSSTAAALFEALGATVDDLPGDRFNEALDAGTVAGAESSYFFAPSLPRPGIATGNVTFYSKVNSFVVNADITASLGDERMEILREAAAATRDWAIANGTSEAEALEQFCANGGTVVAASESDLAALEQATQPVYAELERDPQTKSLLEQIRDLKQQVAASPPAPATCEATSNTESAPATSDGPVELPPNGVYRVEFTADELLAAGAIESHAHQNAGIWTATFTDGAFVIESTDEFGAKAPDCTGTYAAAGGRVAISWSTEGPCSGDVTALAVFSDDELRFEDVQSEAAVDRAIWGLKPWKKIG